MITGLAVAAAISALAAIVADWRERKPPVFFLLKPLTTILITGIAWLAPESAYRELLLAGLLLSLAGDVFLMFEGNGPFIGGLGSFLVAHFIFMWAFLSGVGLVTPPWWVGLFAIYAIGFAVVLLPRAGALKLPVLVYGTALLGMAVTASMRFVTLGDHGALLALIGAGLFVISDSALGARKFIGAYPGAQGLILSTYWLAIGLIAVSTLSVSG